MSDAASAPAGPVLFAYDGSDLARLAIRECSRLLGSGREALVLTVWQPFDVGFVPVADLQFDAAQATAVKQAAAETAAAGALLARAAGFEAEPLDVEQAPAWQAIVDVADDRDANLIVLGSHGRTSLAGAFLGSVAGAVAAHSRRSVLIVHRRS